MKPAPFTYHAPSSLAEAAALLAEHENARLLAGGQSLVPMMNFRYAAPDHLVDLNGIDALQGIEAGATISLGAMTRQRDIEFSTDLATHCPVLIEALRNVGHRQTRNRGTIGGSLANSDPAADYPAAVLGLGATIVTNRREIAADDYFHGLFETALARDEIITAVKFPRPKSAAYAKFRHPASRFAIVGAFVAQAADGVRVAITGAGACAFRVAAFETALTSRFSVDALDGVTPVFEHLNSDLHASAAYRAHLIGEMVRRAVASSLRQKSEA